MSSESTVKVALRIRPQSAKEKASSRVCTQVVPKQPQVVIQDKAFTFDYVFDQLTGQAVIYEQCIKQLVEGAFDGYNATVLAYGQTGSGKTYTMGTSFDSSMAGFSEETGIIPRAARQLFEGIEARVTKARMDGGSDPVFEVYVNFIELYNEDLIDLLSEGRCSSLKIHEDPFKGEIIVKGAFNAVVTSPEGIMQVLRRGSVNRTTAATNMNLTSSRSHAIFTVFVKQHRMITVEVSPEEAALLDGDNHEVEVLFAKFHFVDLAGSERLKRTGATGDRAKEGISINCGLLALGNVISALGGATGRAVHIPYRDSKLTRLLQDSLGGNSRTLMIACASPSDIDFVETLNTLNYANRAKNIKNKVVANQDKSGKVIIELRQRIASLEAELHFARLEAEKWRKLAPKGATITPIKVDDNPHAGEEGIAASAHSQGVEEFRRRLAIAVKPVKESNYADIRLAEEEEEIDDEQQDDYEREDEDSSAEGSDDEQRNERSEEHDRICTDLANLQEEITIKEHLVIELEEAERRMAKVREDYEAKLCEMLARIAATEAERDKALTELQPRAGAKLNKETEEKIRHIREDYEVKLTSLRNDQKKLQQMERQHKKDQAAQKKQQEELQRYMNELQAMKRSKVDLMRKLKEENKKARDADKENAKRVANLEKTARKRENEIRLLKMDAAHKAENLKRKQEEVQRLKEKQRRVGQTPADVRARRTTLYNFDPNAPHPGAAQQGFVTPIGAAKFVATSQKRIRQQVDLNDTFIASPARAKKQWDVMEKMVTRAITQQQTITCMEEDLNRQLEKRNHLREELERVKHSIDSTGTSAERRAVLQDQAKALSQELQTIQKEISIAQQAIVDIDSVDKKPEGTSAVDANIEAIVDQLDNVVDAKYIIQHLVGMVVDKGVAAQRAKYTHRASRLVHYYEERAVRDEPTTAAGEGEEKPVQPAGKEFPMYPIEAPAQLPKQEESGATGQQQHSSLRDGVVEKCSSEASTSGRLISRSHTAVGHTKAVNCVHASETHLISGSRDRTAVIWDLEACREVLKLKNHGNNVNYVHLLPEDRHGLVLTSSLNTVKVWDTRSGICVKHLLSGGLTDEGSNEAIARDNSQLPPGETMIYRAATDADDKHLFTTYFNGVRMWDLEKLESVGAIVQNHKEEVCCLTVTTRPSILRLFTGSRDHRVGVHDINVLTGGSHFRGFLQPEHKDTVVALLCHGNSIFSASRARDLMQFSLSDFKRSHYVAGAHPRAIRAMCVFEHPGPSSSGVSGERLTAGDYLVTACRAGTMRFWDIHSGPKLQTVDSIPYAHKNEVGINDLSANSQLVFTAADDGTVGYWHIA